MDDILTPKEAAAFLRVCRGTFDKMRVPSHPLPGTTRRRYLKSELVEWVKAAPEQATGMVVILH